MNAAAGMTETQARDEICRVGQSLFARGYVHATAGNISVRLDEDAGGGYLITPSDACLGYLEPQRLARLDHAGQHLSGDQPSKTVPLHQRIYSTTAAAGEGARCVIHTHSTYCVALTLQAEGGALRLELDQELLPAITPYFVMKVGHVPLIPYDLPGAVSTAARVQQAIERYAVRGLLLRAVMLERLGPNVWHHTPAQTMAVLEELEETAKLFFLGHQSALALNEDQLQPLRGKFGARW